MGLRVPGVGIIPLVSKNRPRGLRANAGMLMGGPVLDRASVMPWGPGAVASLLVNRTTTVMAGCKALGDPRPGSHILWLMLAHF